MSMDSGWEMVRTAIALAALMISAAAFFFARKDIRKAAIERIETNLRKRINEERALNDERHQANLSTLSSIESRLASGDQIMKSLPNHRDIETLSAAISDLAEGVGEIRGELRSNTRMTERINQFLMEKGK